MLERIKEIIEENLTQENVVEFGLSAIKEDIITEIEREFMYREKNEDELREIGRIYVDEITEQVKKGDFSDLEEDGVSYIISGHGTFLGCEIQLTGGGPTVWLNTPDRKVFVNRDTDRIYVGVDSEVCQAIDEYFGEMWDANRKGW